MAVAGKKGYTQTHNQPSSHGSGKKAHTHQPRHNNTRKNTMGQTITQKSHSTKDDMAPQSRAAKSYQDGSKDSMLEKLKLDRFSQPVDHSFHQKEAPGRTVA
jgi:hypothetical protein